MTRILQKIKLLSTYLRGGSDSYEKRGIRPAKHWSILVTIAFVVFCGMTIFSFYCYGQIEKGKLFAIPLAESKKQMKIDDELFKKVVQAVDVRATLMSQFKQGKTKADPSI